MIRVTASLVIALGLLGTATHVSAQEARSFVSPSGQCTGALYETINGFQRSGNSVTVQAQQLKSGPLAPQPLTDTVLPAFTPVKCYAAENGLVLVLTEEGGNGCGWLPRSALLGGSRGSSNTLTGRGLACPTLRPLAVHDFCERGDELGATDPLCESLRNADDSLKKNPIETKFLTWNATANTDDRMTVPLFSAPESGATMDHDLSVFSVFKVWDIALSAQDELFYLIGPDQKTVEGWVREDTGTVWFSRLTTFFSDKASAPILTAPPGTSKSEPLAEVPPDLLDMLNGKKDFDKYPVLQDKRAPGPREGTEQDPHADVAFIGTRCGEKQLCAGSEGERIVDRVALINAVDVLFVMDATSSMQDYFPIVAEEVSAIALDRASNTNRFGAVMYGDFLQPSATGLEAPMQIKSAIDLTGIYGGDEFETLSDEPLFIADAMKDRPEAAFAALYQAIRDADWQDDGLLRVVIHVADHGDRANAPDLLLDLMRDKNVVYVPIAVRGEFVPVMNNAFATQSQNLVDRNVRDGVIMGANSELTYDPKKPQNGDEAAVLIRRTLRGATEFQDVISQQIANMLISGDEGSVTDSTRYPPGMAQLTNAVKKIYGIDLDNISSTAEARTLAAKGHIALPEQGASRDWDFYAAISQGDVKVLASQFDTLCKSMHDTGAAQDLSDALRAVIQILTGDVLSRDNASFYAYFDNRDGIPLVNRTILGEGILDLGQDLNSFSKGTRNKVETFRLEACRTRKLLNLMDSNLKVDRPWATGSAGPGDLVWNADENAYDASNEREYNWINIGIGGVVTLYLPLNYMPRPYTELTKK